MATNPRIPPHDTEGTSAKRPQLVPSSLEPKRPGTSVPGVLAAIVVAAAILAAILYYMPRAPKKSAPPAAAEVPMQPTGNELQFTNMQLTMAPTGGALNLDGQVMNTGTRPIIGAELQLTFRDASGRILRSATAPMIGMTKQGSSLVRDDFSKDALKPNDARPFRVTVNQVPAQWNHALPEMKVLTVAAEGGH